jgi:uncharacterized protein (DUF924 family)
MNSSDIILFWFEETPKEKRFAKDDKFDALIRERFLSTHQQASQGELFHWRGTPEGRLAEIIVLDQFSRNMFRDDPVSFAQDGIALVLAQEAVAGGMDQQVSKEKRGFFYLPYMHSESSKIHEVSLELYTALGIEQNLEFEKKHKAIIDRFGRFPHRNEVLGRVSTPQEKEFLNQPGSSF